MPLSCDCFPGCWAKHSENWFKVGSADSVESLYYQAVRTLQYGTFVKMGDHLRLEFPEDRKRLVETEVVPGPESGLDRYCSHPPYEYRPVKKHAG